MDEVNSSHGEDLETKNNESNRMRNERSRWIITSLEYFAQIAKVTFEIYGMRDWRITSFMEGATKPIIWRRWQGDKKVQQVENVFLQLW